MLLFTGMRKTMGFHRFGIERSENLPHIYALTGTAIMNDWTLYRRITELKENVRI